jgi:hypothetical protein
MAATSQYDEKDRGWPSLSCIGGTIEVRRRTSPAAFLGFGVLCVVAAAMALGLTALELFVAHKLTRNFEWGAFAVIATMAVFSTLPCFLLYTLLGLMLPFDLAIKNGQYCLKNGLTRINRPIDLSQAEIVISPMPRRGVAWGYTARIRFAEGGKLRPFFPGRMIGTKEDASHRSRELIKWLQEHTPVKRITPGLWGNMKYNDWGY